ncbi:disco-interacting protein 2 homolog C-like [Corticium candelabrum]|uniref:disco-interacting protein 2 homolog C-like n=1 Tax=Corticium candelabrum TaxID=121492 RepID=UPI002E25D891|nr:disco-interacting protein 2 homolog C-like [Corticium candelabrum]
MDYSSLPPEVHQKLADLELELEEGDITQKGYEKRKAKLLEPYQSGGGNSFHSESGLLSPEARNVRAVSPAPNFQQELARTASARAQHVKDALRRHQPDSVEMPMPSKRTSFLKLPLKDERVQQRPIAQDQQYRQQQQQAVPPAIQQIKQTHVQQQHALSPRQVTPDHQLKSSPKLPRARLAQEQALSPESNITASPKMGRSLASVRVKSKSEEEQATQGKVSAKIQQLLNTLRRPKKKKNKEDYYTDDALEPIQEHPNAPKPVGPIAEPAAGEALQVDSNLPRNLEAAIARQGSVSHKAPCISTVDMHGKPQVSITYGKLNTRSQKICYSLLNKLGTKNEAAVKQGNRVALIYSSQDPAGLCAGFFGCVFAGVVPVAIEPPTSKDDANLQQIGFLLGSLGITVALTSEVTMKQLPKDEKDHVIQFRGWPKLTWFVTEHLSRPTKDWSPPPRPPAETPAYIEYVEDKDGSMMGVTVSRASLLCHCKTLYAACHYKEGDTLVCAVDCHGDVGFWHGILTGVYAGMHIVFVPPNVLTSHPVSWVHVVTKFKATTAVVNSRALILAAGRPGKEYKDDNFSTLRMLLVADGSSPWSLHACDTFLEVFKAKGLVKEIVCPCASSVETLTIGLRRPGLPGSTATGRGIMSITGLSYGVVRVEEENSMSSLTLQDCGTVLPGAKVAIVKLEGPPYLCQTDEVGELCVSSQYTGTSYWGLAGKSTNVFKVQPLASNGQPHSMSLYVRTGLLGFLGPGGLIFICGRLDGLMKVQGRRHNTDDLIATVLAVEPHKFVYRQRIAVFSVTVLRDERVVIVAEQRPGCSEDEAFQWMSNVLPAVETIHNIHVYALVLMMPNSMPMTHRNIPNVLDCKQRFIDGSLHPVNLLMSPHQAITNLPQPRQRDNVSGAAHLIGDIVTGVKPALAEGRPMEPMADDRDGAGRYQFLSEVLRWRAQTTPDHVLFTLLNEKGAVARTMTCVQLMKKAERIGAACIERANLSSGDHVTLLYPPGVELVVAFYGCLLVGLVPVPVRPLSPLNIATTLPTVKMIVEVSKSVAILTLQRITKLLRTKEATSTLDVKSLPPILETDDPQKRKLDKFYRAPTPEMIAYLDFSVSTTGVLSGVKMSHTSSASLCRALKMTSELYPSRTVCLCLEPYSGLGFGLWCLSSIYAGHHSILIPPAELEINPTLWLSAVSQNKVRDTFCSYSVMNLCTQELGGQTGSLQSKGINLACVRTCVVVAEERPRIILTSAFTALFAPLGLSSRAVSTSFGCRVNIALCSQGSSQPESSIAYVDTRALRVDRVSLVEKGAPHSVGLLECAKMLPGVSVAIVNPDSQALCHSTELGEIWVSSPHNGSGYYGLSADINDALTKDHFAARLSDGSVYARTGYLGFIKHSDKPAADGSSSDSLYVVGSLDEAITMRSMRYYPIDIETSVVRSHKAICGCAVFTWSKLLVVVVEFCGEETEALDVVPVITSTVLEEHQLIVGIVVVVDPGTIPINSRGERQRMHLRDGFLADELDPIYVAYNM